MAKKNNIVGIDNILDAAFVPESGTAAKREEKMQNALRQEANARPALSLSDILAGVKVGKSFNGTPKEGVHVVKISGEPEVKTGRTGPYVEMMLEQTDTGLCWKTYINATELAEKIDEINFYNEGMLAGKTGMQAIHLLKKKAFLVWTTQGDRGNTYTYFNKDAFERRMYAISLNRERKEEAYRKEKERKDKEARMQEEAELTKKTKEEQEKAPWEE